ncbi:MAG: hypothetical protein WCS71_06300 [Sphaerochaetaceae bacterium]|jgi:uncharacterized protein (DUF1778 family)
MKIKNGSNEQDTIHLITMRFTAEESGLILSAKKKLQVTKPRFYHDAIVHNAESVLAEASHGNPEQG